MFTVESLFISLRWAIPGFCCFILAISVRLGGGHFRIGLAVCSSTSLRGD